MRGYIVNHNGTEDWINLSAWMPADAVARTFKRDDGVVIFARLADAVMFAEDVARDVITWEMSNGGMSLAEARYILADNRDGVPVQIVSENTGRVLSTIDPFTLTMPAEATS